MSILFKKVVIDSCISARDELYKLYLEALSQKDFAKEHFYIKKVYSLNRKIKKLKEKVKDMEKKNQ